MAHRLLKWLTIFVGVDLSSARPMPTDNGTAVSPQRTPSVARSRQDARDPGHFDVDVVITWVDSTDAEWRSKYTERLGIPAPHNDPRFTTVADKKTTELSLCLDLLRAHLPWTRRTFIVTMAPQRPRGITNATVVHHSEMGIPLVFNYAWAIESRLHAIPGLAERFIYLNDDVFVLRPLQKSAFFLRNGMPIVRGQPTDESKPPANAWEKSNEQTVQLVSKMNTSRYVHRIVLPHIPLAMTRRSFLEAQSNPALREAWAKTTSCAQRYTCDELIPPLVVLLLQLGEGAPFEPAPFRRDLVFGKHTLGFSYWVYQEVKPDTTIPNVDVLCVNVPTLEDTTFYDRLRSYVSLRAELKAVRAGASACGGEKKSR